VAAAAGGVWVDGGKKEGGCGMNGDKPNGLVEGLRLRLPTVIALAVFLCVNTAGLALAWSNLRYEIIRNRNDLTAFRYQMKCFVTVDDLRRYNRECDKVIVAQHPNAVWPNVDAIVRQRLDNEGFGNQ
jgi:hypothetical protein